MSGEVKTQQPPLMTQHDMPPIIKINIKESFAFVDPSKDDVGSTSEYELYVDHDSSHDW